MRGHDVRTAVHDASYSAANPTAADGWRLERLTAPSRLFGANGLRTGPDGRVYVAQVTGSQISALDLEHRSAGHREREGRRHHRARRRRLRPQRQPVRDRGDGRPGERARHRRPDPGAARRPSLRQRHHRASGPAVHRRVSRWRTAAGARLAPEPSCASWPRTCRRPMPWRSVPTGCSYYPLMTANEIWRIDPDGGEPQRVAGDLGVPDAVKFDSEGFIVSTQVASGQVLRIDPRNGEQTLLAQLDSRPGQSDLRRRPVVRLELHRRDHRDPVRRRHPHRAARRAELAAGSGRGR